jgi:hypothetical protein
MFGESWATANPPQKAWRNALGFRGPGDYRSTWRKYRKYIPRAIGAGAGFYKRGLSGLSGGWDHGARVSKAMGWGDYSVNQIVDAPSGMNPQQNVHHVSNSGNLTGDIIYSNSEFVQNIYANVTSGASEFEIQGFDLNPGLAETFPFLSQIAQNFELFEMQGLMFQYKPTSGEYGSNNSNALGKVVLATNYDPDAPLFTNTVVMENYDYACATKPSDGCLHGVECKTSQRATNMLYTRNGISPKDKVFTDIGTFQIATEGIPSAVAGRVIVGELWVTYTCKLSRSKLFQGLGESISYASTSWTPGSSSFSNNAPLGVPMDGTIGVTLAAGADTDSVRIVFDSSLYVGSFSITTTLTFATTSGASIVYDFPANCTITNPSVGQMEAQISGELARSLQHIVNVDANGSSEGQFDIGLGSATGATINTIKVLITKVDKDI